MKVLLVGANGFLGQSVLEKLIHSKFNVDVLISSRGNRKLEGVQNIYFSKDLDSITISPPDIIINVAAYIPYGNLNEVSSKLIEANIHLPLMLKNNFPDSRFIHTSSVSVYGDNNNSLNELSECISPNAYGLSKLLSEKVVNSHSNSVIFRISSMYGKGMKPFGIIPFYLEKAKESNKIPVLGIGERLQDYIFVNDVADLIISAIHSDAKGVFLAANGVSQSNLRLAEMICNIFPKSKIELKGIDDSLSRMYDTSKTKTEFGSFAKTTLSDGLMKMVSK
ncbi:NAD(P)-dependent oxidoreductase [Salibacteraceae bacterium]|nr:NAD(P)-dependent oxidoreductase [Salibacteraceae bacterium]MDC1204075.1 NAD(P)-dependent oxidoreductase [Salibacteraceae bacterium]